MNEVLIAKMKTIPDMGIQEIEALEHNISMSDIDGKPKYLMLEAIDDRREVLSKQVDIMAVDSEVKAE